MDRSPHEPTAIKSEVNAPSVHRRQDKLEGSDIMIQKKRPLSDISPSVKASDLINEKNKKEPPGGIPGHGDNLSEIVAPPPSLSSSSEAATASPASAAQHQAASFELNMKGSTRLEPIQSSRSVKQKTRPMGRAINDTTVTISIGRIEVKAISSHAQQQEQPPTMGLKKRTGLSLQEYLKLRDDGQL